MDQNNNSDIGNETVSPKIDETELENINSNIKIMSPTRLVLKRFFRSKLSVVGLFILIFLFLFSFIGPMLVPYTEYQTFQIPSEQKTASKASFTGADGETYTYFDVATSVNPYLASPSADHWLGTDNNGMDIFVRLMYGGRISLTLSFIVVFLETILGVLVGGAAGYFGKAMDTISMRIVDIINCLPTLPILLITSQILRAIPTTVIPAEYRIYYLMGMMTLIGWGGTARLVRGQILSLREQEFMVAAEASGLKSSSKIFRHLIPNVMPQLIVSMTLGLGGVILYEATLSYLGLGVQIPRAAWGTMISLADPSKGQNILTYYPNIWVPPGILIVLAVLAFNFVGDGLRDAFDPKMKR